MGLKIEYLDNEEAVYDLTVEKNHNFFANDILVHNCIEITEVTDIDRTFVCCLSSLNLEKYDEWKDNPLFIKDITEMLDNVLSVFEDKASLFPELQHSINSVKAERSIGLGTLGFHAYLQQKGIPFESALAVSQNKRIFNSIRKQIDAAEYDLVRERGEPEDLLSYVIVYNGSEDDFTSISSSKQLRVEREGKTIEIRAFDIKKGDFILDGYNLKVRKVSMKRYAGTRRNINDTAIAPNASSALIMGTSPSIEPYRANVYSEKGVNGLVIHKNKYLTKILEEKGHNTDEVWSQIIANEGSVQSLKCLTDYEKDVFKTATEIDQTWLIQHAADRQEYITQSQSLNLFFDPRVNIEMLHLVHLMAWKKGLKSLYYCRSDNMRKADKVGQKVARERIEDMKEMLSVDEPTCIACE